MALIEFELSPAWKRVSGADGETTGTTDEPTESATTEETPQRVEVVDETEEPAPRRRRVTLGRVLGLAAVVGAVVMARRMWKGSATFGETVGKESALDVEAADEQPAE